MKEFKVGDILTRGDFPARWKVVRVNKFKTNGILVNINYKLEKENSDESFSIKLNHANIQEYSKIGKEGESEMKEFKTGDIIVDITNGKQSRFALDDPNLGRLESSKTREIFKSWFELLKNKQSKTKGDRKSVV